MLLSGMQHQKWLWFHQVDKLMGGTNVYSSELMPMLGE
jgi:hypothetical protein